MIDKKEVKKEYDINNFALYVERKCIKNYGVDT